MSGLLLQRLLILLCFLLPFIAAIFSLRKRPTSLAVLVVTAAVPVERLEVCLRRELCDIKGKYSFVMIYCLALDEERLLILQKLAREQNAQIIERGYALWLWRKKAAEFWRMDRYGEIKRIL